MRVKGRLLSSLCAAAILFGSGAAHAVEIKNVSPRFFDRADFQSLSEYFGAEEEQGNRLILRSVAERRDGLYFVVDLDQPVTALPDGAEVVLDIVDATAATRSLSFPLADADRPVHRLLVGLTGDDWPTPGASALAWRVSIRGPEGHVISEAKSFLWEMP